MWIFSFYRFYSSLTIGIITWFVANRSILLALGVLILVRTAWFFIERFINELQINRWFSQHAAPFKELSGPYAIRLINKADSDRSVRNSLAEVFTPDLKKLRKTVDSLEVMDTIFKAGMRPDGDSWQLHDLKLKYGKHRLQS